MALPIFLLAAVVPANTPFQAAAAAFDRNDSTAFYKALDVIAKSRHDSEEVAAFNSARSAAGEFTFGEMLFSMRAKRAAAGAPFLNPRPTPFEAVFLLPELNRSIDEALRLVKSMPAMAPELTSPKELGKYDELFQELSAAQNQCGLLRDMSAFGEQLQKLARRMRGLTDEQRAALDANLLVLKEELVRLHELAKLREIDLRLQRATLAAKLLADVSKKDDTKLRLLASHYLDRDGAMLQALVQSKAWSDVADQLKFASASTNREEMHDFFAGPHPARQGCSGERLGRRSTDVYRIG